MPVGCITIRGVAFPKYCSTFKNTRALYVIVSLWGQW